MKRRPAQSVLVISIDVNGDSAAASAANVSLAGIAASLDATKWLLGLLEECHIPATWFFTGPGTSVLRSHVMAARTRHEVGLLIVENCANAGRLEFRRDLQRRVTTARAVGIEIASLAVKAARQIDYLDLLVKHGIRAVRLSSPTAEGLASRKQGWAAVSTLRFGISSLPATLELPEASGWQSWLKRWETRRHLRTSVRQRQYCHLALDVHQLANPAARETLRQTLRLAAKLTAANQLQADTVSSVAATLMARPSAPSARSILRAA